MLSPECCLVINSTKFTTIFHAKMYFLKCFCIYLYLEILLTATFDVVSVNEIL